MLYEDPSKDISSDERFHVELHFSPGVNCCVQKENLPGPGFNPKSKGLRTENVPGPGFQSKSRYLRTGSIYEIKPCCIETSLTQTTKSPVPLTASFNCNKENLDKMLSNNSTIV